MQIWCKSDTQRHMQRLSDSYKIWPLFRYMNYSNRTKSYGVVIFNAFFEQRRTHRLMTSSMASYEIVNIILCSSCRTNLWNRSAKKGRAPPPLADHRVKMRLVDEELIIILDCDFIRLKKEMTEAMIMSPVFTFSVCLFVSQLQVTVFGIGT